jgi:hypothetical protein
MREPTRVPKQSPVCRVGDSLTQSRSATRRRRTLAITRPVHRWIFRWTVEASGACATGEWRHLADDCPHDGFCVTPKCLETTVSPNLPDVRRSPQEKILLTLVPRGSHGRGYTRRTMRRSTADASVSGRRHASCCNISLDIVVYTRIFNACRTRS